MARLKDALDAARRRLFVGRRTELARLAEWLGDAAAPTRVVCLQGMGGIGKSTLLREILRVARREGAGAVWMDGRACTRSPAGFLDYLDTVLAGLPAPHPPSPGGPAARLSAVVGSGRRVVLGIDNFDDLAVLEGWLREDFLGVLPDRGILVVLASRPGLSPVWLSDPVWRGRVSQWSLSPLSREEAHQYLALMRLDGTPAAEALVRAARGHPLALALGAERLQMLADAASPDVSQAIGAHLLLEVAAPELHPLLETLSVLREGDQELLSRVLGEPVSPDRYHALARLSFIAPAARGLALHDTARVHLLADLRRRAPGRFRLLRRRALAVLRERLAAATGRHDRRHIGTLLLALCQDALPDLGWVADMTVVSDLPPPTPPRPEDRLLLHALLEEWTREVMGLTEMEDEHRLLDALLDRFPENVWVSRTAEGKAIGFMAVVPLHRETAALLERHRAGALYLKRCPSEERAALDCSPEEVDTYIAVLGGMTTGEVGYARKEVLGAVFHEYLSLLGEGTRLLGVANNPEFLALMGRLGFRLRPDCRAPFGDAPWPFQVGELDLRGRDFGQWVEDFLDAVERKVPAPGAASPRKPARRAARAPAPADPALVAQLRAALAAIDHPARLHDSPLARRLGRNGRELRALLWDLLTRDAPAAPLTPDDQAVLRAAFAEGNRTPEAAAARLHLSRATYYRKLRAALESLAEALTDPGDHPRA